MVDVKTKDELFQVQDLDHFSHVQQCRFAHSFPTADVIVS